MTDWHRSGELRPRVVPGRGAWAGLANSREFVKLAALSEITSDIQHRQMTESHQTYLAAAIEEARKGLSEGGVPIGSVLVHDGHIIGRGHNRRVQQGSVILHGEMDALENAGRQPAEVYRACTIYTTLSPCPMCSGAIILYGIPQVVIGENSTFMGAEEYLRAHGVKLTLLDDPDCVAMMRQFIRENPSLWSEDIGEQVV